MLVELSPTQYCLRPVYQPSAPDRPSIAWLALALALAIAGLALATLVLSTGLLSLAGSLILALVPSSGGLGIAVGMLAVEVILCV